MYEKWRQMNELVYVAGGGELDAETTRMIAGAAFGPMALGFSRQNELDADTTGIRWMSRLGYDPNKAIGMLEKMRKKYGDGGLLERYFSAHPAAADRQQTIRATIDAEGLRAVAKAAATRKTRPTAGNTVVARRESKPEYDVAVSKTLPAYNGETPGAERGMIVAE
jgi:predicted Zn-dependent protease